MSLFPDHPPCALRQRWWQSGARGLCQRKRRYHLFGKSRTTADKKEGGTGRWKLRSAVSTHPILYYIPTRDTLSLSLSLLASPFLPICLLHSLMLVWWTAGHSPLSCMEAQGGAGSPGKSHFLFLLFSVLDGWSRPSVFFFLFWLTCAVENLPAVFPRTFMMWAVGD